jgi:opacity protein-like surface antigen
MGGEWMMGKFATATALLLLVLTTLWSARGFAQASPSQPQAASPADPNPATQTPASQTPAAQTPSAQAPTSQQSGDEPADIDEIARRKARPRDYKKWNYNVGAGANTNSGATKTFVRGGGVVGTVGVARNVNKYLGLRGDFIFADLPLRDSTLELAQATGATTYALAFTLDPVINIPVTEHWGGYILFGPSYLHRSGSLDSSTTSPGSSCTPFWTWWGSCTTIASISLNNNFVNSSQNEFGYNFGGGITRKMPSGVEIYAEYRFVHGSANNTTTDFHPITLGVRW